MSRLTLTILAAALLLGSCGQVELGPREAPAAAPATTPAPELDLSASAGLTLLQFEAGAGAAFAPVALGLSDADQARLARAMAQPQAAVLLEGAGARALAFRGCGQAGCDQATALYAIDAAGDVLVVVRDGEGETRLAPNEQLEALVRLNSPDRRWDR